MLRVICVSLLFALGGSLSVSAATLSVQPDKFTYTVGETITLSIHGDAEGATSYGIYGRLEFDGSLVDNSTNTQKLIGPGWVKGSLTQGDTNSAGATTAFADTFSQVKLGDGGIQTATNPIATVTLIAQSVGIVYVNWNTNTGSGFELSYFGLTSAAGTAFCIANTCPVPEPTTGSLVGLGLLALAASHSTIRRPS